MTNKTIHVTNESGIVSDTYVDLLYTVMGRDVVKPFKIEREAKEALEKSIQMGKTTIVDCRSGSNLALNSEMVESA